MRTELCLRNINVKFDQPCDRLENGRQLVNKEANLQSKQS